MLRSVDWWLVTDVSGYPIGSILKGQAFACWTNGQRYGGEECLLLEAFDHNIVSKVV
jgi:hypothetical protein